MEDTTTITANLTQQADSSISILADKTLVYPGAALALGPNRLTLSGGGVLGNENSLTLNDPSSVLSLNGIAKVAKVAVTGALTQGKLEVAENVLVETLLHSESSRIDIANGKQLTVAEPLSVQSGQSMELLGMGGGTLVHDNLTLSGTLKISAANTMLDNGTLILNSSRLDLDESATIASDLVHEADSTVEVLSDKTLTYSGAPLKVGGSALTLSGGGRIANANDFVMDDPLGVLNLDGIAEVEQVAVTGILETGRLNVLQDALIQTLLHSGSSKVSFDKGIRLTVGQAFEVPDNQSLELMGSGGVLALNDNLTLSGSLRFSGSDHTLDNGILVLNGGLLAVEEDTTMTSTLTHQADSTMSVLAGKTLNHSGETLGIGPRTLTLTGGGTLENANSLTLNHPASVLKLDGLAQVSKVAVTDNLTEGKLEVTQSAGIATLSHSGTSRIDLAEEVDLSVADAFEVPFGQSLELIGTGGRLTLGATLTLSGTLKFSAADNTLNGGSLRLNGGVLDVDEDAGIASDLANQADSTVDVSLGKTLTYSGNALNIGPHRLTLTGNGIFSSANQLILNEADSVLELNGPTEISQVAISGILTDGNGKLEVVQDVVIHTLAHPGSSRIDLAEGKRLTVSEAFEVPVSQEMELMGAGSGVTLHEALTLSGTLRLQVPNLALDNGSVVLSGGSLEVENNTTMTSDLQQSSDSTVKVGAGKTLTYLGGEIGIGPQTLTLGGSGTFANTDNLTLNNPDSVLKLSGIQQVSRVAVTADSLKEGLLDVDNDTKLQTFAPAGSSRIDIADSKRLVVGNAFEIQAGHALDLVGSGGGTLVLSDNLTVSGTLKFEAQAHVDNHSVRLVNGRVEALADASISSRLVNQQHGVLNVEAGSTLSLSGGDIPVGASSLQLSGGGEVANDDPVILDTSDSTLKLSGTQLHRLQITADPSQGLGEIAVSEDSSVVKLLHEQSSKFRVGAGKILTLGDNNTVLQDTVMAFVSESSGAVALEGTLHLEGELLLRDALKVVDAEETAGSLSLDGGQLRIEPTDAGDNITVTSEVDLELTEDSAITVAEGSTLLYLGDPLQLGAFTLTLDGKGQLTTSLAQTASAATVLIVLSDAQSRLILQDAVRLNRIQVTSDSADGYGLVVNETEATIDLLSLLANLQLSFADEYDLQVGELDIRNGSREIKASGNLKGRVSVGRLSLQQGPTAQTFVVDSQNMIVEEPVTVETPGLLETLGEIALELEMYLDASGSVNLSGEISSRLYLQGGTVCILTGAQLRRPVTVLASSTVYIAPGQTLSYLPTTPAPIDVGGASLTIRGGGTFANASDSLVRLNSEASVLELMEDGTRVQQIALANALPGANLRIADSTPHACGGDVADSSVRALVIDSLTLAGSGTVELANAELTLLAPFRLAEGNSLELAGNDGKLRLSSTGSNEVDGATLLLSGATTLSQGTLAFSNEATLHASGVGALQQMAVQLSDTTLKVDEGQTLSFDNTTLSSRGALNKTSGGSLVLNQWSLEDNSSLTSDASIAVNQLSLSGKTLNLLSEFTLTIQDNVSLGSDEHLNSGPGSIGLQSGIHLSGGELSSTGGTITMPKGIVLEDGTLDLTDSILEIGGAFEKTGGASGLGGTSLQLLDNLTIASNEVLEMEALELNDHALTLASATSDLTVKQPLVIDAASEGIATNDADLRVHVSDGATGSSLSLSAGFLTSSSGEFSVYGESHLSGSGVLSLDNSTLTLEDRFEQSGGALELTSPELYLRDNLTWVTTRAVALISLDLNGKRLTLGSSISDLEVEQPLTLSGDEALELNKADLTLKSVATFDNGSLTSSGGFLILENGGSLNGAEVEIENGELQLGADFTMTAGSLQTDEGTTLRLASDLSLTGHAGFAFAGLQLDNHLLTLGSDTSSLTIGNAFEIDVNEGILTQGADFTAQSTTTITGGSLTSSGGTLRFEDVLTLQSGTFDSTDSTVLLNGNLVKTGGTWESTGTTLSLDEHDITIQSDTAQTLAALELGDQLLTLGSETTDLTIQADVAWDDGGEGVDYGVADLTFEGKLTITDGKLVGSGGTLTFKDALEMEGGSITAENGAIRLSACTTSSFGDSAIMLLTDVEFSSGDTSASCDSGTDGTAIVKLLGEPDLSSENGTISYIHLLPDNDSAGTISTDTDTQTDNLQGFDNGSYNVNASGIYHSMTSSNLLLSESDTSVSALLKVKLLSRPSVDAEVTVELTSLEPAELEMSTDQTNYFSNLSLTYLPETWNQTQSVYIRGKDDDVADGDREARIIGYSHSTEDTRYQSTFNADGTVTRAMHAFKYTFVNINDDIAPGRSPTAVIGDDQKMNEATRVMLDGSGSYDPDTDGFIVKYTWSLVGRYTATEQGGGCVLYTSNTESITLCGVNESLAYFTAPTITGGDKTLLFNLEVMDNTKATGYASTVITVIDTVEQSIGAAIVKVPNGTAVDNSTEGVLTIRPRGDNPNQNSISESASGGVFNAIKDSSGNLLSEMSLPQGTEVNMNRDASTTVAVVRDDGTSLSANMRPNGTVTLGVTGGATLKSGVGSTVTINADGSSTVSASSGGSLISTTFNADGSSVLTLNPSTSEAGRSAAATASQGSVTLNVASGVSVAVSTTDNITATASTATVDNGTGLLTATINTNSSSQVRFDNGSVTTQACFEDSPITFWSPLRSSGDNTTRTSLVCESKGYTATESVSLSVDNGTMSIATTASNQTVTSTVSNTGVTTTIQGDSGSSSVSGPLGTTVSHSSVHTTFSSFQSDNYTVLVSVTNDGMVEAIARQTQGTNPSLYLPKLEAGSTVNWDSASKKLTLQTPLSSATGRTSGRSAFRGGNMLSELTPTYTQSGLLVGTDVTTGEPVFVSGTGNLLIEQKLDNQSQDNQSTIQMSSGSGNVRTGNGQSRSLSGTVTVSNVPKQVSVYLGNNLVALPSYTTVQPSEFERKFGSYSSVAVRRNGKWYFYARDNATQSKKTSDGFVELTSAILPGEGIWVEAATSTSQVTLEIEDAGGYEGLAQLTRLTEEWTLVGASQQYTASEIVTAANYDRDQGDDDNSLGMLDSGGPWPPTQGGFEGLSVAQTTGGVAALLLLMTITLVNRPRSRGLARLHIGLVGGATLAVLVACGDPGGSSSSSSYTANSTERVHSLWKWCSTCANSDNSTGTWQYYAPDSTVQSEIGTKYPSYSTFSSVNAGEGYWVRISETGNPGTMALEAPGWSNF